MTIKAVGIAYVLFTALLMSGCGKVRYPDYYTLAVAPSPPQAGNGERAPGSLAVRDFETPAYLRQGRIVYRKSPTEIGFYEYHRWVNNPGAIVTTAMIDALRSSDLFSQVDLYASHVKADFQLRGRLERLEEIDYGGRVRVEVKLSAQLVNMRTASTVWSGEQAESVSVEKATVNSVVTEMTHATQKCINGLLADMRQHLGEGQQRPSDPGKPYH